MTERILLVDDNPSARYALDRVLSNAGYTVSTAGDGKSALEEFARQRPDLVIMDVNMPVMDGFEAASLMRRECDVLQLPIIFTSATYKDVRSRIRGLDLGGNDYVTQPVDTGELLTKVNTALRAKRLYDDLASAQQSLSDSEARFRQLFDTSYDLVSIADTEGRTIWGNPAWMKTLGYTPKSLGDPLEKIHPEDMASFMEAWEAMERGEDSFTAVEYRYRTADGGYVALETTVRGAEVGGEKLLYVVSHDLTRRKKQEAALRCARNLESIGTLAGGIAHDFNNLLALILGNIDLARSYVDSVQASRYLSDAEKAVRRAVELASLLLICARGGAPIKTAVSLADTLRDFTPLLHHDVDVEYKFSFPDQLPPVRIDEVQFKHVFSNLIRNAAEAMPEGGTIRISLEKVTLTPQEEPFLEQGCFVRMTIADEGRGISGHHLEKLFDPYFTTKPRDSQKGVGLGLAICHSIITRHGGTIRIESEVGCGTRVHVYLPIAADEPERDSASATDASLPGSLMESGL